MASSKDERILNLVFVLLNTKQPLLRAQIRERVDGYPRDSDMAFERMFERDKAVLRDLGIPLLTQRLSEAHDDVEGYIIDDESWMMQDLFLTPTERVLVSLAAHAWGDVQVGKYALDAASAVGASESVDGSPVRFGIAGNQVHVAATLDAIARKRAITFKYQGRGVDASSDRTVDPWRLLVTNGNWYLLGFDRGKQAQRTFKLSRIHGGVHVLDEALQHPKPEDFDAQAVVAEWHETDKPMIARVRVPFGDGASLRLLASRIESTDVDDVLTIEFWSQNSLARTIAGLCPRVTVESPVELRKAVQDIVSDVLERHAS